MAIPSYQEFMNPVLAVYADLKEPVKFKDTVDIVADKMRISDADKELKIKSGLNSIVHSRVHWATYYMYIAGLLSRPKRGLYEISEEGRNVLKSGVVVNDNFLKRYPSFIEFMERSSGDATAKMGKRVGDTAKDSPDADIDDIDPEERIARSISELDVVLKNDLLDALKSIDPKKFEQVVVDLMVAMDYGVGQTTRYVGDGGIDGIIDEDELGLSKIYLQAKRYSEGKVQEKEMRDFVGALGDKPVSKAVFITTSAFSDKAIALARNAKHHIVRLIDGQELIELMIKHNLGVQLKKGYEVKEINTSFFED